MTSAGGGRVDPLLAAAKIDLLVKSCKGEQRAMKAIATRG
jgi:hypothetical protein